MLRSMLRTAFSLLLLSLALCLVPARAQFRSSTEPAEIRGQVRYARGNAPAANVLVRLEALSGGFVGEERTDNLGKFRFTNLNPIQYFIYIRQPGFKEIQREVNLVMTASDYIQIQLVADDPAPGAAHVAWVLGASALAGPMAKRPCATPRAENAVAGFYARARH